MNEELVTDVLNLEKEASRLYEEAQAQAKNYLAETEVQAAALLEQKRAAAAEYSARRQAQVAAQIAAARAQQLAQAQAEAAALQGAGAARLDLGCPLSSAEGDRCGIVMGATWCRRLCHRPGALSRALC